jgi:hypothetical protein
MLLVGCAKINDLTKLDAFDTTSQAYSHAIRWSEFDEAAIFIKSSDDKSLSPAPEVLKMIRVTDYAIRKTAVSEDQTKVFQVVEVSYYRNDRMVVKTIREKELWEWNSEAQKWELSSGLPDFK